MIQKYNESFTHGNMIIWNNSNTFMLYTLKLSEEFFSPITLLHFYVMKRKRVWIEIVLRCIEKPNRVEFVEKRIHF